MIGRTRVEGMHLLTGVNHLVIGVKSMTDTDHTAVLLIGVDLEVNPAAEIGNINRTIETEDLKVGNTIVKFVPWTTTTQGSVRSMQNQKTLGVDQGIGHLLTKNTSLGQTHVLQKEITLQKTC